MTKVFLDTEFVDDGRVIDPVSLPLVTETGAEYYAVFADGGVDRAARDEWLRVNVVPHLPVVLAADGSWAGTQRSRLPTGQAARPDRRRSPLVHRGTA